MENGKEIKVKADNSVTLFHLVISCVSIVVTMIVAMVGFSNTINDRIGKVTDRVSETIGRVGVLEEQQISNKEWRKEIVEKLDIIINTVTELKVEYRGSKN
jgi:hypothetical protein